MGDTELIALGAKFRKAWAAERAAFLASGADFDKDPAIEAAQDACKEQAEIIARIEPATLEGIKVHAMVWGWMFYLSLKPGEYEGADSDYPGERAAHTVMSFLLKDCAA
ncbi:hypothetical protein X768_04685 [Mesorhizobium sp. LSJC265A00]|uniref:hypothetical protein n=1 Tax=Mesorhizobium sp. LSJC265A00 TaxID=1287322 RepID=UPI0003CE70A9|nr:hypothetical protein [Mesorhizobium sp. LSJC265A00]ESX13638.1 hypothetical protein X768_04685 [Mesorhizobium sp. LSJC265A00]